jgi:hypothetical protein
MAPRAGRDAVERIKIPYPCRESKPDHLFHSLVTTPTDLSRFQIIIIIIIISSSSSSSSSSIH